MLYGFGNIISAPIDHLADAYEGNILEEEKNKIIDEIDSLDVLGKCILAGGAATLGLSYLIYNRIPRVGKLMGAITAITGIATGILGYDLQTAAQNLQDYFDSEEFQKGRKVKIDKEKLKDKLVTIASKGTAIRKHLFKYALDSVPK